MIALRLLPVIVSLLLLGAHFLRADNGPMIAAVAVLLALLAVPRAWAARLVQVCLVLGAVEWIRTLARLAGARAQAGEPALRLSLILGLVAAWTLLSALVFETAALRRRHALGPARRSEDEGPRP